MTFITIFHCLYIRLDVSSESSAGQRIHMKNQALFSSTYKSKKKIKCRLLQYIFLNNISGNGKWLVKKTADRIKRMPMTSHAASNTSEQLSQTGGSLKDCTGHCSYYKAQANLEGQHSISWIKDESDALPVTVPCMPVNHKP